MKTRKRFSIRTKMYIFVIITILVVAFGTAVIAFTTSTNQIDQYYKQNTSDNARNFASRVDGDFLKQLRKTAESKEFQELRKKAEAEENEALIEDYLMEHGLWDKYSETRRELVKYLDNMEGIKYLYIVAHGNKNSNRDMYLIDDLDNPIYEMGYYEDRESDLLGIDITNMSEPTISNGDWGWLCSDFKPVYDSTGECVCVVGCDIGMDDVMAERQRLLIYFLVGATIFTVVGLTVSVLFINRVVVNPLNKMTNEMKKFSPSESLDYKDSHVINFKVESNDEISEIYNGIHDMQIHIIDYLKELLTLQRDKERAEYDIKAKEKQIGQLSKESFKDALTGVGNKAAYNKKLNEINQNMKDEKIEFAILMVDMNNLKKINDEYGHKFGDIYIKGCCNMVCETFKHSPIFRIGGDEFVVILMGRDYDKREEKLEKLKEAFIVSYKQSVADPWRRYSAALGMAENTAGDNAVEAVFKRADKEMYEDKAKFKKEFGIETR
ncbi:MAG: GGDEF domain-containing protein [Eubacterium sp.]|nr:GGDEF domain-containing protein [Eubacterium sp.]